MDNQLNKKTFYAMLSVNILIFMIITAILLWFALFGTGMGAALAGMVAAVGRLRGWWKVLFGKRNWLPELTKTLLCALLAAAVAWHYRQLDDSARRAADKVVEQVQRHHAAHGRYPDKDAVPRNLPVSSWLETSTSRLIYLPPEKIQGRNTPLLAYRSPVWVFDDWLYDFDQRAWEYRPD